MDWRVALGAVINYSDSISRAPAVAQAAAEGGIIGTNASKDDPMTATTAWARSHGHEAYADRSLAVQAVMERMYNNDSNYHSFSALFVAHTPDQPPGSMWIDIQQPDRVNTAAYSNDSASGAPVERVMRRGQDLTYYVPAANSFAVGRQVIVSKVPPLSDIPLGFVWAIDSGTTIMGQGVPVSVTAEMYVHPSTLITSPFFANKSVSVVAETTFAGRAAWELRGEQAQGAPVLNILGDGWRMWVDKQTGIVLRLEYHSGSQMIGWAEMRDVSVDGTGVTSGNLASGWTLPSSAREVDLAEYRRLVRAHR